VGLRPLAFWDCGFESRGGHRCLSLVSVVCCQVEVSATSWSLVQRSPTECVVSECDREASKCGGLGPQGAVNPLKKKQDKGTVQKVVKNLAWKWNLNWSTDCTISTECHNRPVHKLFQNSTDCNYSIRAVTNETFSFGIIHNYRAKTYNGNELRHHKTP
jgi:hypothetical protein